MPEGVGSLFSKSDFLKFLTLEHQGKSSFPPVCLYYFDFK
ncbi:Uncharacterized protein dnm_097850 [Desulfonema magnum]|uniref:Uncharacterized protein n=1 Tax=Desulfonema magnum TaxID=45655 RepID=A0A975BXK9_9BACT|nr:Uncharacterized protein dnm_097850 [Desulfonema magnum]